MHDLAAPGASGLDLVAFLTLGLLGSAGHCAGMCAPFVLLVARRYTRPVGGHSPLGAQLWYAAGRLVTYAGLGAVAGALGGLADIAGGLAGLQRSAAIVAGALLVVGGVAGFGVAMPGAAHGGWITRLTDLARRRLPAHPLTLGLGLGFLPCGLLYTAVAAAVAQGSALAGAGAMTVFGLGTVPALLGVSLAEALVLARRTATATASHVFVMAMGLWYLWRGLGPGLTGR